MKTKFKLFGFIAMVAVIGFMTVSCKEDDPYKLEWCSWSSLYYSSVKSYIGSSFIETGTYQGYVTGSKATDAYNEAKKYSVYDSGTETGEWTELLNFSKDGIGLPAELKSAMSKQEANVPVGGVFGIGAYAILFYITKN